MRYMTLMLIAFSLASCTPVQRQVQDVHLDTALGTVPAASKLLEGLQILLRSQASCSFPPQLIKIVPNPPGDWSSMSQNPQDYCLGACVLNSQQIGDSTTVVFRISPRSGRYRGEPYMIVARYLEEEWLFTWPFPLGAVGALSEATNAWESMLQATQLDLRVSWGEPRKLRKAAGESPPAPAPPPGPLRLAEWLRSRDSRSSCRE